MKYFSHAHVSMSVYISCSIPQSMLCGTQTDCMWHILMAWWLVVTWFRKRAHTYTSILCQGIFAIQGSNLKLNLRKMYFFIPSQFRNTKIANLCRECVGIISVFYKIFGLAHVIKRLPREIHGPIDPLIVNDLVTTGAWVIIFNIYFKLICIRFTAKRVTLILFSGFVNNYKAKGLIDENTLAKK